MHAARRTLSVMDDDEPHLEAKGLLERQVGPGDRRRTLVWLTPEGFEHLDRDREVLATPLLARAPAAMTLDERTALLTEFAALLAADDENGAPAVPLTPTHRRPRVPPLKRATRAYMATMPAWRDHPAVSAS